MANFDTAYNSFSFQIHTSASRNESLDKNGCTIFSMADLKKERPTPSAYCSRKLKNTLILLRVSIAKHLLLLIVTYCRRALHWLCVSCARDALHDAP